MSLKHYSFKPTFIITLLTLCLLPILVSLGFWQLHRAEGKQQLQTQYNARTQTQPVSLQAISRSGDLNYTSVKMRGRFDNAHRIFLDNKIYQHQIGYQVLIPFKLVDSHQAVLINLGWIAQGNNRNQLPEFSIPSNERLIYGIVNELPRRSFSLGANADPNHQTWPLRLQHIDIAYLTDKLGYPIESFMILLAPDQPFGLVRDWSPATLNPQMHLGYAFQWFALAVTLVILFIITSMKRR